MISYFDIEINDEADYYKLEKEVKEAYIDDSVIKLLKENLSTKCQVISGEFPYYDSDYLSSYYPYYSKKHRAFSKECYRLLFYADKNKCELMGYVTLRPTYENTHLCRMYFEPDYILKNTSYVLVSENKVHLPWAECALKIFPQIGQDSDFCVCAHVSAWSILRFYSNKFRRYPEITMGGLSEKVEWNFKNPLPSQGLTAAQISNIFHKSGYAPICIYEEVEGIELFREKLFSYLESGIPLVGGIINKEHAVTIIGQGERFSAPANFNNAYFESVHDYSKQIDKKTNIVMADKFMTTLVVNDDNFFPYKTINKINLENDEYSLCNINYLIVPLYDRITLLYEDVKKSFLEFASNEDWRGWSDKYIARIFLTSANTYKEYFRSNELKLNDENALHTILGLDLPKIIWCIELSTSASFNKKEVDHIVILDSTSTLKDQKKFIFIGAEDSAIYINDGEEATIPINHTMGIPIFDKNFEKVK